MFLSAHFGLHGGLTNVKIFNRKNGATLVEIVMAILILACAFIPILRLVDYGSVNTAKIGNYARATRLAQELIEECKHIPFKAYKDTYGDLDDGAEFEVKKTFIKKQKKV